jgi:hypothetical protein
MKDDGLQNQLADAQQTIQTLREELAETNRGLLALRGCEEIGVALLKEAGRRG